MPPELHTEPGKTPTPSSVDSWDKFDFWKTVKDVVPEDVIAELQAKHPTDLALAVDDFQKSRNRLTRDDEVPPGTGDDVGKEETVDADSPQPLCYRDQMRRRKYVLKNPHRKAQISAKFERYVLLVRRVHSMENQAYAFTIVEVRGAHLRKYLCEIFRGVSGFPLTAKKVELNGRHDETKFLFWARRELSLLLEHLDQLRDESSVEDIEQAKFEIKACLQFVDEEWGSMLTALDDMVAAKTINFEYIWALLPPGSLIVSPDPLEEQRVYRLDASKVEKEQDGSMVLKIAASYADFDHRRLGYVATILSIPAFPGQIDIMDLPVVPFRQHSDTKVLQEKILERTSRQLLFFGEIPKLQRHQGRQQHGGTGLIENEQGKLRRFNFRGRLIVDLNTFAREDPDSILIPRAAHFKKSERAWVSDLDDESNKETLDAIIAKLLQNRPRGVDETRETARRGVFGERSRREIYDSDSSGYSTPRDTPVLEGHLQSNLKIPLADPRGSLTLEQRLTFPGRVYGYSLGDERWGAFSVNRITDVEWNTPLLKSLVMEEDLKEILKDLIETHAKESSPFDDFVWGKGKGLVGLLSGPPGSGKTLTAEAIAETAHMPLYIVSSGSLGSSSESVSRGLSRSLRLASHWNAVLLVDEADVFLAKRSTQDLERNAIVAVFLRELEYYTGILILTTNLPEIIDEAVENRIHFFHHYQSLDEKGREQVWRNFVTSIKDSMVIEIEDKDYTDLSRLGLNGRQIKNVMSISVQLAMVKHGNVLRTDRIIRTAKTLQKPRPLVKPKPSALTPFAPRKT